MAYFCTRVNLYLTNILKTYLVRGYEYQLNTYTKWKSSSSKDYTYYNKHLTNQSYEELIQKF